MKKPKNPRANYSHLIGCKINFMTIISSDGKMVKCKCDCGVEKTIPASRVISGGAKSCGCYVKLKDRREDLSGKKFNRLLVLGISPKARRKRSYWECLCDCGKTHTVLAAVLKNGTTKSCGCLAREVCYKPGDKHFRWEIIRRIDENMILCKCECGTIKPVSRCHLLGGKTKSCGCYNREVCGSHNISHGKSGTFEHRVWKGMISRCHNKNTPSYKYYGAQGVIVCDEWRKSFTKFLDHVGLCPPDKESIDRINPYGNYESGNVRWASRVEQNNNNRKHWDKLHKKQ